MSLGRRPFRFLARARKAIFRHLPVLWLLIFALPPFVEAGQNDWTQTMYFENDLFTGTDRNYTNGVKFSLISPDLSPHAPDGKLPRRILESIHRLPFIHETGPGYVHKVEFSLGQNMYTPADISRSALIVSDRPYAGWTYISTSYHRKNSFHRDADFMDTIEMQLGIIGPESFAEEAQKFIHQSFHRQRPNGWDNQLENEPGLAIIFERKWLFHPGRPETLGCDAITHAGVALGNVYTYMNAGVEFRAGWNIPRNFGVSLIRPAGSTRLMVGGDFGMFGFGAVNARFVARDIFLDGNSFARSHSVDKNNLVADLAAGIAVNFRYLMLTWTQVLRTTEFAGQKTRHSFGAIALSFSFPVDWSGR